MRNLTRYRKAMSAAIAALATTVGIVADGVTAIEGTALVTLWGGVLMVYLFPNDPPASETADPDVSERG